MNTSFVKLSALLTAVLLVSGCQSLLPKGAPPSKTYTLNAPTNVHTGLGKTLPHSIQIMLPQAAPGLETERVALRSNDNRIEFYKTARWAEPANTLVQALLVESFDNSHAFKSVSNDLLGIENDYGVLVEMRDFQVESSKGQPHAHIRFVTKLIRSFPKQIVMTRTYNVMEKAQSDSMVDVMNAFDRAYQRVASDMIRDVAVSLQNAPQSVKKR